MSWTAQVENPSRVISAGAWSRQQEMLRTFQATLHTTAQLSTRTTCTCSGETYHVLGEALKTWPLTTYTATSFTIWIWGIWHGQWHVPEVTKSYWGTNIQVLLTLRLRRWLSLVVSSKETELIRLQSTTSRQTSGITSKFHLDSLCHAQGVATLPRFSMVTCISSEAKMTARRNSMTSGCLTSLTSGGLRLKQTEKHPSRGAATLRMSSVTTWSSLEESGTWPKSWATCTCTPFLKTDGSRSSSQLTHPHVAQVKMVYCKVRTAWTRALVPVNRPKPALTTHLQSSTVQLRS